MAYRCFKQGCELETQYICLCLSSLTYFCEFHLQAHLKLPNRAHDFDCILAEPSEETKDAILEFLAIEKVKKEKLKKVILAFSNKNWNNVEESLKKVDSDLNEISDLIEKLSQVSGLILKPSMTDNDAEDKIGETALPSDPELYGRFKRFVKLDELRKKRSEILSRTNNDPEIEQEFRKICLLYENQASDSLISQTYQECINAYHKITSTYLFDKKNNLYIYDVENEREEMKILEFGRKVKYIKSRTPLPNGELFFIVSNKSNGFAFIIDRNYQVRELKTLSSEKILTAIYFDRSIYWFGYKWNSSNWSYLSQRFDLDENQWIELAQKHFDGNILCWDSIIYNGNIVISNHYSSYLLLYSIDIDSFSEIPYKFANNMRKFLINAEKRLYLIECSYEGCIYESEPENEYIWKNIGNSIIPFDAGQVYSVYNKEGINISISDNEIREYFKFDLSKKSLIEIAYYSKHLALKRQGDKLEAIECSRHSFKLDSYDSAYINKKDSLYSIGSDLEKVEHICEKAKLHPDSYTYIEKGDALCDWGRNLEAIECYNEAIKLDPDSIWGYTYKGSILRKLGRNLESIECYNEVIRLRPDYSDAHSCKGDNLYDLGRYFEAIECFNEVIKLARHCYHYSYFKKGEAFACLGRYSEAIECYSKIIEIDPGYIKGYFSKGKALCNLGRDSEAIECFKEVIRLRPHDVDAYNSKSKALRNLGRNLEALECYNEIIKLEPEKADGYFNKGNSLSNLGRYLEAIECYDEAIKRRPDDSDIYNSKGYALFNTENYLEAIECYNMAIKLKPDNSIFLTNRAKAFNKLGRDIEALQDLNKADEIVQQNQKKV